MLDVIKSVVFDYQLKKCHQRYQKKAALLKDPYKMWIEHIEVLQGKRKTAACGKHIIEQLAYENFVSAIRNHNEEMIPQGWFAVALLEGTYQMPTGKWQQYFEADSKVGLIYGDEDMEEIATGFRYGAWFKPDESPDTLLAFFYYGSLLFLQGHLIKEALQEFELSEFECTDRQCVYDFILFYTEFLSKRSYTVLHIPEVLFHSRGEEYQPEDPNKPEIVSKQAYWGYEPDYDLCRLAAIKRRGLMAHMKKVEHANRTYHIPVYDLPATQEPKVSIVIPSKDNVEVLTNCIQSILQKTEYPDYEIILVDNGSNEKNRAEIEQLKTMYDFIYIYEPMPFNFSKMCNLGVAQANGEYILLLNDDMEIIQPDWLTVMVGQAAVAGIGAVGAKLLYPGSDLIQHVGITNLWVGPAHKLIKEHDDEQDYYYGRNVLPYDMLGVTAACFLVSTKKYQEAGGLCEEVAVSYNDVDFCFSLYDLGYRNIIRNDVKLYHHESLSRGDDAMSEEKWNRLLHEKDFVYKRHLHLKGKDPYYSPNLAGFKHKYFCSYLYPYEQRSCFNEVKDYQKQILEEWHNDCLTVTLEHARLERKLDLEDEQDVYWLEGWAYVLGMDCSRYKRSLLLIDEHERIRQVSVYERYRPDVVSILPEQTNVELAGFSCRIKKTDLKPGKYRVALLYIDCCSRQKLYKECDKEFVVE